MTMTIGCQIPNAIALAESARRLFESHCTWFTPLPLNLSL
jgi:hypothetical protein